MFNKVDKSEININDNDISDIKENLNLMCPIKEFKILNKKVSTIENLLKEKLNIFEHENFKKEIEKNMSNILKTVNQLKKEVLIKNDTDDIKQQIKSVETGLRQLFKTCKSSCDDEEIKKLFNEIGNIKKINGFINNDISIIKEKLNEFV